MEQRSAGHREELRATQLASLRRTRRKFAVDELPQHLSDRAARHASFCMGLIVPYVRRIRCAANNNCPIYHSVYQVFYLDRRLPSL